MTKTQRKVTLQAARDASVHGQHTVARHLFAACGISYIPTIAPRDVTLLTEGM